MKQYFAIKAKYPDAILLFRVGDFYETFGEDAIKAAGILGIVLTKRANGSASFVELAGFPHHSLDTYLPKLVRAGLRVAICDQLEDPKLTKKIVKRGVTELVTPGVSYNDKILEHKKNNFLAAYYTDGKIAGVAFIDISTGEFLVGQGNLAYAEKLLQNFNPSEVLYSRGRKKEFIEQYGARFYNYGLEEWVFQGDYSKEILLRHFGTKSLKGFGIEEMSAAVIAAGAALHYVSDTRQEQLRHISGISRIDEDKYVWLDKFTIRNLELVGSSNEQAVTLLDVLDHTLTPMGGRLLKRWVMLPLKDIASIEERQDAVNYFLHHPDFSTIIAGHLKQVGDLERLISKVALGKISPREVMQLKRSLDMVQLIKDSCGHTANAAIQIIADQLNPCSLINSRIFNELHPDAPAMVNKGGVIREGVNSELDELRSIAYHGKDYLLKIQQREAERTGITSLKVGFNNVFGYFIEVTHTHKDKVPAEWTRKQTLTNAERYITEELKQYEEKILGAEEKILALESRLFTELVQSIVEYIQPIQLNAGLIGRLDVLLSFSDVALKNEYVRPIVNDSSVIDIRNGRHPVIEKQLPPGEKFIANDIYLDNDTQQILMITGPNMSGKSALLRQTALITLLAQTGSFVPASAATIGYVDKIFTRVGASDNISSGESTFMVEMNETASILHNLSDRSLILLDEIGRGTATYDGVSIAWAIAEYLHNHTSARAKTLFATHYHEMNEMAESLPRIRNFHVSVKELENKVLFLRKLVPGGSEHSFGIHVARMAGIPAKVVSRADEILHHLEKSRSAPGMSKKDGKKSADEMQLSFFQLDDPVLEQIREEILRVDIDNLTPMEALNKLNEIKKLLGR
ncbi:MAG: DNA mismatch repair protein MutS [Bacteroidia bacterium]|nr:DNA mismatch repair protein MutS [Bacteroidia bacterium]MBP6649998.1 DNA mismatch repair protein MutS [Bacteroidia bacterium]